LSAVRNVGEAVVQELGKQRENDGKFKSLQDLLARIDLRVGKKRAVESLIRCGAFLSLGISRKQALENLDSLVESASRRQIEKASGQMSLFSFAEDAGASVAVLQKLRGDGSEFSESELQAMEHELLGFYITSHPLARVVNRLRWLTTHSLREVQEAADGASVILGGLCTGVEKKLTKQNKLLAILHLEDLAGKIEAVIYGELLETIPSEILTAQSLLLVKGKVKKNDEGISMLANGVRRISDASLINIYMTQDQSFADLHRLKEIHNAHKGADPVLLPFPEGKSRQALLVGCQYWVKASSDLAAAISAGCDPGVKVLINRVLV